MVDNHHRVMGIFSSVGSLLQIDERLDRCPRNELIVLDRRHLLTAIEAWCIYVFTMSLISLKQMKKNEISLCISVGAPFPPRLCSYSCLPLLKMFSLKLSSLDRICCPHCFSFQQFCLAISPRSMIFDVHPEASQTCRWLSVCRTFSLFAKATGTVPRLLGRCECISP